MAESAIRVLVVDDFLRWRSFASAMVQKQPGLEVVGEVSDGLEAIDQATQLQPDLILLDIGLPTLSGIEAARRIREVSPKSKIIFVTENRSADIVRETLRIGAGGYVVKSDAAGELLPAMNAVLEGKRFLSASLAGCGLDGAPNGAADKAGSENVVPFPQSQNLGINSHHEVGFYSEDRHLLEHVTQFIAAALREGNAAIVVATEPHRESLFFRLQAEGLEMGPALDEGRYISLDAAETLSTFMVNGMPDPVRFLELLGDLIMTAKEAARGEHPRVSVFGECVDLLWAQGKLEAAIQMEKLGSKIARIHGVNILCGYSPSIAGNGMDSDDFERICAEHSAVHSL